MPIVTAKFERHTFRVDAVRVTATNMESIAEWCDGRVVDYDGYGIGRKHVQVPVGHKRDKMAHAHIGSWVTCLEGTQSFRHYKEGQFLEAFREIIDETEKYAKIHRLLMKIRRAQDDATYHGETSEDVMLLIEKTAREICAMV